MLYIGVVNLLVRFCRLEWRGHEDFVVCKQSVEV